jgi:raffinose/stachyose/melibiose transport system permease protein
MTMTSGKKWVLKIILSAVFLICCYYWVYPFLWLLSVSLKTQMEVFSGGLRLLPKTFQWQNYADAWITANFGKYMLNTVIVTIGTVLLTLIRIGPAGYVLGRYNFVGRKFLLGLLIITFIVPQGYTIIPIVEISRILGILNSLFGIILVLGGTAQIPNLLLFAAYFRKIPQELEESARIDGAGFYTIFFRIMLPLATPIIVTVCVMNFLYAWNAFFVPLVFTFSRPTLRTLAVGMMSFAGTHETDWPSMAAAATIALVPLIVFFFFVQRYIVEGFAGAVKG